jgi:hypothetical protein
MRLLYESKTNARAIGTKLNLHFQNQRKTTDSSGSGQGWLGNRIFLFRKIRNNDESDFNFAKFREIPRNFIQFLAIPQNFIKYRDFQIPIHFAKLFRYVNFSNPMHKESILINILHKISLFPL